MIGTCAICGEPLGEDGLCAACMLGGAFETTVKPPATDVFSPSAAADLAFDSFGPYTILRVLGEGGMGAVYLAEQFEPIHRKVALKVIKTGLDSRSILSRFNYERQTLAMMNHPNIAQVYDASTTAKGRPFFVMEYIAGEPITKYCDRHRLNTRQRLGLFVPVCLAVQHAHSKGILHRDIKPTNVLVAELDGVAVPKVIDFGIAKATDQHNYQQSAFTEFGQFVGTPEYMSPEAADLVGGGVDTTSDVYSLGVLLYELLVGAVPFDAKALRKAGMAELLRILREENAPSLPAKLTSLGQIVNDIAARRASTPVGLRKEVSGELNLITLKAVEKDRTQRYDSARALGDDIERFLDSRPVKACPPTLSYRLRKYGAKHRGAVAAGIALLVALTAGGAATLWQARNAIRERAVAVAQRARAESEAAHASAEMRRATEQEKRAAAAAQNIRSLANSILFDDQLKDTGSIAARTTLLNLGLQYLQKADASDPNLGAAYFRVAELQESLRDTDRAEASYQRAAELLQQRLARDRRDSESRRLLACTRLGHANLDDTLEGRRAQLKEAERALRSLVADEPRNGRAMLDLSRVLIAEATSWNAVFPLHFRAYLLLDGSPEEAVSWAEKAVQAGANKPSDMAVLAEAQNRMIDWVVNLPRAMEDVTWGERAVATLEAASSQEPSNTKVLAALSAAYTNLAIHHWYLDEQEKAVAAAKRALETAHQAVAIDPENPSNRAQLARSQAELASHSSNTGTLGQFRTDSEEVTHIYREQIARYPGVLQHRLDLASWLIEQFGVESSFGNYREALNCAEQAVAEVRYVLQQRPGDRLARRTLSLCLGMGGEAHTALREYSQAQPLYEEALAGGRALLARSPGIADYLTLGSLEAQTADGLYEVGHRTTALEHYRAASAIAHRHRDAARTDRMVLWYWNSFQNMLADTCFNLRDMACLRAAAEDLRPILQAKYEENPYDLVVTDALLENLRVERKLYIQTGQSDALLAVSRRSEEIAKKIEAAYPANLLREGQLYIVMNQLSVDLRQLGLRDESLVVIRKAAAAVSARLATPPFQTDARLTLTSQAGWVIRNFDDLDEPAEGLSLGLQVIPVIEAIVENDPNNQRAVDSLLSALWDTSGCAWDSGSAAEGRDLLAREVAIRLRRSPRTSWEFYTLARHQIDLANVQERLQERSAAARERDAALESLGKSYVVAERAFADSKGQSVTELARMRFARQAAAVVLEQQEQLAAARKSAEEALEIMDRIVEIDNDTIKRDNQRRSRALLFRLMELTGASDAEFQQRCGSSAPLIREQKLAFIAEGWRLAVTDYAHNPHKAVLAAQRAVDGYRALLRESGPAQQRVDLALALNALASAYQLSANFSTSPAELVGVLENGRRASQESVDLLGTLRAAGALLEINQADWSSAKILVASMESKLAAARNPATAKR